MYIMYAQRTHIASVFLGCLRSPFVRYMVSRSHYPWKFICGPNSALSEVEGMRHPPWGWRNAKIGQPPTFRVRTNIFPASCQDEALAFSPGWAAMLPAQLLSVLHCPLWMPSSLLHFVSKSVETLSFFQIRASSNRARSFFSVAAYASLPSKSRNGGFRSCVNWTIA